MKRFGKFSERRGGFTLVELLVSITILIVLATLVMLISRRGVERARAVQCVGQMRDLGTALEAFIFDYQRPPLPESRREAGMDTVYGNLGGQYGNEFVVAVLAGGDGELETGIDEDLIPREANPKGEVYYTPSFVGNRKYGVYRQDSRLYDPWGRQIMIAVNTPPYRERAANGMFDEMLMTDGLAVYQDTEPRDQQFVMWSYGKDGVKAAIKSRSDDVISW